MRVLLLDDGLGNDRDDDVRDGPPVARWMRELARDLRAAGCEVRGVPGASDAPPTGFPSLTAGQADAADFTQVSDAAIAAHRHWLRRVLDRTVDEFAPDVIHAAHIWLPGHLALESGVPYVLSTWGDELPAYQADARLRPLIEQAAENASRIVADREATRERVLATFGLDAAIVTMPGAGQPPGSLLAWLIGIYQQAIDTRRTAAPPRL